MYRLDHTAYIYSRLTKTTETYTYLRCVQISTKGAQREMVFPSVLAIVAPILTGHNL